MESYNIILKLLAKTSKKQDRSRNSATFTTASESLKPGEANECPMRIEKCWFCSANKYPAHGVTYVRSDSATFNFCRSKCYKLFMKRLNPRKIRWTKISRVLRNKEIIDDNVHKLERRVNTPIISDKNLLQETVSAIPRILHLKKKKQDMFIKGRLLSAYEQQKKEDLTFIKKHEKLLNKEKEEVEIKKKIKKEKEVHYN